MQTQNPKPNIYDGDDDPISLKRFLLGAVLWLPLGFFLWFAARTIVVAPVIRGANLILPAWMPDVVSSIEQDMIAAEDERMTPVKEGDKARAEVAVMFVNTKIPAEGEAPNAEGKMPVLSIPFNPLIYCYGIPLLIGLVMATPLTWRRTFIQFAIGFAVMYPAQVFGVVGDVLKDLAYGYGPLTKQLIEAHGINDTVIAMWYQFGYLILPPLVPVVVWILMNRDFVEKLRDAALPNFANDDTLMITTSVPRALAEEKNAAVVETKSNQAHSAAEPVGPFAGLSRGEKEES